MKQAWKLEQAGKGKLKKQLQKLAGTQGPGRSSMCGKTGPGNDIFSTMEKSLSGEEAAGPAKGEKESEEERQAKSVGMQGARMRWEESQDSRVTW